MEAGGGLRMALNEFYDYNGKCYAFAGKRTATASCLFEIMRETIIKV